MAFQLPILIQVQPPTPSPPLSHPVADSASADDDQDECKIGHKTQEATDDLPADDEAFGGTGCITVRLDRPLELPEGARNPSLSLRQASLRREFYRRLPGGEHILIEMEWTAQERVYQPPSFGRRYGGEVSELKNFREERRVDLPAVDIDQPQAFIAILNEKLLWAFSEPQGSHKPPETCLSFNFDPGSGGRVWLGQFFNQRSSEMLELFPGLCRSEDWSVRIRLSPGLADVLDFPVTAAADGTYALLEFGEENPSGLKVAGSLAAASLSVTSVLVVTDLGHDPEQPSSRSHGLSQAVQGSLLARISLSKTPLGGMVELEQPSPAITVRLPSGLLPPDLDSFRVWLLDQAGRPLRYQSAWSALLTLNYDV